MCAGGGQFSEESYIRRDDDVVLLQGRKTIFNNTDLPPGAIGWASGLAFRVNFRFGLVFVPFTKGALAGLGRPLRTFKIFRPY